ncbi:MAG: hypothetical protein IBX47_13045, partial [Desulfuromonadales bacterium]|nr:hypothetical protein [Desulfuromonadales bacterium]
HAEFSAQLVGDYGNVTVMEVQGDFSQDLPDGLANSEPREQIAREFFKTHKDEYDFIVIFTNFNFPMRPGTAAFYGSVRNDTEGIGEKIFDRSSVYGSNGRLQGTIDMGNLANHGSDPLETFHYSDTLNILNHEIAHRWGARISYRLPDGSDSDALLGMGGAHWSYLLNTGGSLMYGNNWQDNGDGTFTSLKPNANFSPLDLYLMGLIDKDQVPPMLLIANPSISPEQYTDTGETISGTPLYVTIDDIIAAMGERVPNSATAPKSFSTAFIYATYPGTFNPDNLTGIESIRNGFLTRFSIQTDGQALVQVATRPPDNLPVNPGIVNPSVASRSLPADIGEGVDWLIAHQAENGSWLDSEQTVERDSAEAVSALNLFAIGTPAVAKGEQWLVAEQFNNTDYLARKIETMSQSGQPVAAYVSQLVALQNKDGGWGVSANYLSNPADTGLALRALGAIRYANAAVVTPAIDYLLTQQNADGGWGANASLIQATSNVMEALNPFRTLRDLEQPILLASNWLQEKQNSDGGFGNSPSTVYDSSAAMLALIKAGSDRQPIKNGANYLLANQGGDGSWNSSAYQTAAAIKAVYRATEDPDLVITADKLTIIPAVIDRLPMNAVISAEIVNSGRKDVVLASIVLYRGRPEAGEVIDTQQLSFPGQARVVVTFLDIISAPQPQIYTVVVDPLNEVAEQSENNNQASIVIEP